MWLTAGFEMDAGFQPHPVNAVVRCQRCSIQWFLFDWLQPMWHVELTSEQSLLIRRLINGFVDRPPEKLDWQIPLVREHDALPLYIGWTETQTGRAFWVILLSW